MPTLTVSRDELVAAFRALGIETGDVVYVASSLAALGMMENPVGDTLAALQTIVGAEGTLVMPTFNFGFCHGECFDRDNSPSQCGKLSEAFRKQSAAVRTNAPPFHSVCATGPRATEISTIESVTSFGRSSAFQWLHDVGAKHLLIGCGFNEGVAHVHWLEELHQVPYRYWKRFEGDVVCGGQTRRAAFFMYARRMDVDVQLDADPLGADFERAGHLRRETVGLCRIQAFDIRTFKRFADPLFEADPLLVLRPESRRHFGRQASPVRGIHHIGIASRYAERIREVMFAAALVPVAEGVVEKLGVRCAYLDGLNVKIEIVDPVRHNSCIEGHLGRHSTSPLHHIAFEVTDMDQALAYFREKGLSPLDGRFHAGPEPGQRVIFLSPLSTGGLLVELVANDGLPVDIEKGEAECQATR